MTVGKLEKIISVQLWFAQHEVHEALLCKLQGAAVIKSQGSGGRLLVCDIHTCVTLGKLFNINGSVSSFLQWR